MFWGERLGFRRRGIRRVGRERVKGIEPSSLAWKAIALPLSYTRFSSCGSRRMTLIERYGSDVWWTDWLEWGVQDSNLRRHSHLIYSQAPLTARETPLICSLVSGRVCWYGGGRWCLSHVGRQAFPRDGKQTASVCSGRAGRARPSFHSVPPGARPDQARFPRRADAHGRVVRCATFAWETVPLENPSPSAGTTVS